MKTPKPAKRKVGAKRMWSTRGGHYAQHISSDQCVKPVFVLPADAQSVEAMREQVARAMANPEAYARHEWFREECRKIADAVLRAIKLTPPPNGSKGGA